MGGPKRIATGEDKDDHFVIFAPHWITNSGQTILTTMSRWEAVQRHPGTPTNIRDPKWHSGPPSQDVPVKPDGSRGLVEPIIGSVTGAVVKLVVERGAPAGISRIRSWLKGQTIVIVGPSGAGKSTFLRYLEYGLFLHEQEHETTYRPVESPRFELALGPNKNLNVSIKKVIDLPGQDADAAELVAAQRPHALVIVVDISTAESREAATQWFNHFFTRLDQHWHGQKAKKNRLRSVLVALNKVDKIDDEDCLNDTIQNLRQITDTQFKLGRPKAIDRVHFRTSVMVENPEGTKTLDALLIALATSLAGT